MQPLTFQISTMIIGRSSRLTHFLEWRDYKIVFKRYASLYFAAGIEKDDNELIVLDVIHHFVEILDKYFGNVCELDLIFNFHQAYFILEEMIIGGALDGIEQEAGPQDGRAERRNDGPGFLQGRGHQQGGHGRRGQKVRG